MWEIRFTNSEGKTVTATIKNKWDLKRIAKADAKNSIILSRIGNGMPTALHNAIAEHNAKIESAVAEKV